MATDATCWCGKLASVHICKVEEGRTVEEHLCAAHFQEPSGVTHVLPSHVVVDGVICWTAPKHMSRGLLDSLRGLRNFLQHYGRMPRSIEEVADGISFQPDGAELEPSDPQVLSELKRLERLIQFVEAHKCVPVYWS